MAAGLDPRQLAARGREALEARRAELLQQMHQPDRPSAAAAELRRVEEALALVPREVRRPWTWQQRGRRRRRNRAT